MAHVYISAAHKSSGKTTVTLGLAAALSRRGLAVQPFKKGPDYIDPMWLGLASGRSCRNLDFHLMSREEIVASFARHGRAAQISLIEGNKGLYDGLDLHGSNSNAALASLLGSPVVLVIDARGMTRGIAPLILGYQAFDPSIRIAGVILNNLGGARHEQKLRAVIGHYTGVEVIGAVPHDERISIVERHLGLVPSNEAAAAAHVVEAVRETIEQNVDLGRLLAIAQLAKKRDHEAVAKLKQARLATEGAFYRRQLSFGLMDLVLHTEIHDTNAGEALPLSNQVMDEVFLPRPANTAFLAYFGHIIGYGAGYYGYAWADAIAADMATVFEKAPDGYFDKQAGMRLRKEIYEVGDSRDVNVSIEKFLGRPRSLEPFLRKIGIEKNAKPGK